MDKPLHGKSVAIIIADGFEQVEYTEPKKALEEAGATTHTISINEGEVKGWNKTDWGEPFPVDRTIGQVI